MLVRGGAHTLLLRVMKLAFLSTQVIISHKEMFGQHQRTTLSVPKIHLSVFTLMVLTQLLINSFHKRCCYARTRHVFTFLRGRWKSCIK